MNRSEGYEDRNEKEVSVIIAIRNEEQFIAKCLDSFINQDMSHDVYEIIVVDGMSDDKTRKILSNYKSKYPNLIKVFDNPKKIQAVGWNLGIRKSSGKIIQIFGGHAAVADSDYLNIIRKQINNSSQDIIAIGGVHTASEDEKFLGKVMSDVQSSILGGFGTGYRIHSKKFHESVPYPVYKKNLLKKTGAWFDENLVMAQDLEFNLRLREAGFKLMLFPDAKIFYYRRHNSLKLLAKRMFKYGFWRTLITKKHPKSFRIHLFFPFILIISVASLPFFAFRNLILTQIIVGGLITYFLAILTSSIMISIRRKKIKYIISFPVYLIHHFSYGLGTIFGLFKKIPTDGNVI